MEHQAYLQLRGAQVIVKLPLGCGVQLIRGLGFDNNLVVNDHVETLGAEFFALIHDVNAHFTCDNMSPSAELALQRQSINVLEKPKAQRSVDAKIRDHGALPSSNGRTGGYSDGYRTDDNGRVVRGRTTAFSVHEYLSTWNAVVRPVRFVRYRPINSS
jgi:hypothetical protein